MRKKIHSFVFHFLSRPFDINTPETRDYKFIGLPLLMSLCLLCCHGSLVRGGSGVFRESQLICCTRRIPRGLSYCFYRIYSQLAKKCRHLFQKTRIDMRFCSDTVIIVCSCSEQKHRTLMNSNEAAWLLIPPVMKFGPGYQHCSCFERQTFAGVINFVSTSS